MGRVSDFLGDAIDPPGRPRGDRTATLHVGTVVQESPLVVNLDGTDVPDMILVPGYDPRLGDRVMIVGTGRTKVLLGEASDEVLYRNPKMITSGGVEIYVADTEPPESTRNGAFWIKTRLTSDLTQVHRDLTATWDVDVNANFPVGRSLGLVWTVGRDPAIGMTLPSTPSAALGVDTGPPPVTPAVLDTYEAFVGHPVIARTAYPVAIKDPTLNWVKVVNGWKQMINPADATGPAADPDITLNLRMPLIMPGMDADSTLVDPAFVAAWREMGAWARVYNADRTVAGTGRPRLVPVWHDLNGTQFAHSFGADATKAAKVAALIDLAITSFYEGLNLSGTQQTPFPGTVWFGTGYTPTLGGAPAIVASIPRKTTVIDLAVKDTADLYASTVAAGGTAASVRATVWSAIDTGPRGIVYFAGLAEAYSKMMTIGEFAVGLGTSTSWGGDNATFITNVRTRVENLLADRLLLHVNYSERDDTDAAHKLDPGTTLPLAKARFLLATEFGSPAVVAERAWLPTTFADGTGFSAYAKTEFDTAEAWIGHQVEHMQIFYLGSVAASLSAGLSTWNSIVSTGHWSRAGGRQMCVTVSGPLGPVGAKPWSQTYLQTLVASTADKAHFEAMADRIVSQGMDVPYPDGKWKLIVRFGLENNVGAASSPKLPGDNRFFPHQYWDDTTAAYYRQALEIRYGWMQARMRSLGGHPENVGWAFGMAAKDLGTEARLEIALPKELPGSSTPGKGFVNVIDVDIYWDQYPFGGAGSAPEGGKTKAQRRAQDNTVKALMFEGKQGLSAALRLAQKYDLLMTFTEVALQIRDVPQNSASDIGGGDAPLFVPWFKDWVKAGPLAQKRWIGWEYTFSNQGGGGDFICRLDDARLAESEPIALAAMNSA